MNSKSKIFEENGDAMKQLAEIEKEELERPFYRFFAIEYFATGEGMSFWLKVCRCVYSKQQNLSLKHFC